MNILEKIFDKLHIDIMSRKGSPSISAKGNVNNSPIIKDSPHASVTYNETKTIPYPKVFKARIESLRTNNKSLLNVKYILPDGKEALIPEMSRGEEYNLFYTNEDLSDVYISDKYKFTEDMQSRVCWIATLVRNNDNYDSILKLGPRGKNGDHTCYVP